MSPNTPKQFEPFRSREDQLEWQVRTLSAALKAFADAWDAAWHGYDFAPTDEEMKAMHNAYDEAHAALASTER